MTYSYGSVSEGVHLPSKALSPPMDKPLKFVTHGQFYMRDYTVTFPAAERDH